MEENKIMEEENLVKEKKVTGKKKSFLGIALVLAFIVVAVFLALTRFDFGSDVPVDDDGVRYNIFKVEETTWLAENLNDSNHEMGESWCYDEDQENCSKYGRLYDLEAAMVVCPEGWRLPTYDDWAKLEEKFEEIESSVLSDVRGGHSFSEYFYEIDNGGYWWSSTMGIDGIANIKYLDDEGLKSNAFSSDHGLSVRCVKN